MFERFVEDQRHKAVRHRNVDVIATQARVAFGDGVGAALDAEAVVVLIGERPGLSAADSLGAYLTYRPTPGLLDSSRNCISDIRYGGLSPAEATRQIAALLRQIRSQRKSGVTLQSPDEYPSLPYSKAT